MISKSTLRSVATGLFVLLAALLAANLPAHGASGPWQQTDTVEGRLIAAVEGTGEGAGTLDRVPLGLHLKMKPGWKTYWRSPGDAGLPPQLSWEGSGNLAGELRGVVPHGPVGLREGEQVRDTRTNFSWIGGLGQEVSGAGLQGLAPQAALIVARDHDGRNIGEPRDSFDCADEFHAVHAGHVVIGDHDADLGRM